jgi:hypothetical protein
MLLDSLKKITDSRRNQSKKFDQAHILLFTVIAGLSGADSYRKVAIFIRERFKELKKSINANGNVHHRIQPLDE